MKPETIAERAARIRLSRADLSRATGLSQHSVGRTLNEATEPLHSTFEKIQRVIVEEEQRLLAYLIDLHGIPAAKRGARRQGELQLTEPGR